MNDFMQIVWGVQLYLFLVCILRYQTLYQLGVLLSRSSLHCVKIRRVWILSVLQVRNENKIQISIRGMSAPFF